jgi:hypothetical protein
VRFVPWIGLEALGCPANDPPPMKNGGESSTPFEPIRAPVIEVCVEKLNRSHTMVQAEPSLLLEIEGDESEEPTSGGIVPGPMDVLAGPTKQYMIVWSLEERSRWKTTHQLFVANVVASPPTSGRMQAPDVEPLTENCGSEVRIVPLGYTTRPRIVFAPLVAAVAPPTTRNLCAAAWSAMRGAIQESLVTSTEPNTWNTPDALYLSM